MDPEGPLWYRGLSLAEESGLASHVEALLKRHCATRIVVGHTVTDGTVTSRFSGQVVRIDVGPSALYGARLAYFTLESGRALAVNRGELSVVAAGGAQ